MTRSAATMISIVSTLLLLAAVAFAITIAPEDSSRFSDAATMLAFAAGVAVGIERTIEITWTIVGSLGGSFWPLNAVSKHINTMITDLDTALRPIHEQARKKAEAIESTIDEGAERMDEIRNTISGLMDSFEKLKNQPRDPQRIMLIIAAAQHEVTYLQDRYGKEIPELEHAEKAAKQAIDDLQNFLASFKDNPGRRLISLYIAAIAGLVMAGAFGLDIFTAVMADGENQTGLTRFPELNVVLTGIIIGLGSSPTHEVIRLLQEYKESQKGGNARFPNLGAKTGDQ